MTEQDLTGAGLVRMDSESLEVQAWHDHSEGIYYIYRPSNGKLYLMPDGHNNYDDALTEIQQWLLIRAIINKLDATSAEKNQLKDMIPRRSLVGQEVQSL